MPDNDLEEVYNLNPEEEIPTDPAELDIEWIRQSGLFMKYSKAAAAADRDAKKAHENVKIVRAELVKEANANPDKCLGEGVKATAPVVEAYYRNHDDHKNAKDELIEAEYQRDILAAAKSAVYMRKSALENLVKLAAMNWFSAPVSPRDLEGMLELAKERDQNSANKKVRTAIEERKLKRRK